MRSNKISMKKQTQLVITKGLSTALTFDTGSFDFFEIDERDLADSKLARSNCCLHNDTHENKVMIRIAFNEVQLFYVNSFES